MERTLFPPTQRLALTLGITLITVVTPEGLGWCQGMANDPDQALPVSNGGLVKLAYGEQGAMVLAVTEKRAGGADLLHVFGSPGPGAPWTLLTRTSLMEVITGLEVVVAQGYNNHVVPEVAHVVMTMDHVERICGKDNVCSDERIYSYAAVLSGPPLVHWAGGGHLSYADLPNEPWPTPITVAAALANQDYNGQRPQEFELSVAVGTGDWVKETHLRGSGLNTATFSAPKDLSLSRAATRLFGLSSIRLRGVVFAAVDDALQIATLVHTGTDRMAIQFSEVSWLNPNNQPEDVLDCRNCAFAIHDNELTVLRQGSSGWEAFSMAPAVRAALLSKPLPGAFSAVAEGIPLLLTAEGWTGVVFSYLEDVNNGVEVYGLRQMEWLSVPSGNELRVRVEDQASGRPASVSLASHQGTRHGTIAWLGKNRALMVDP